MLRVSNLQSGYGDLVIIHGVSLEVAAGEILCILGHNGVGKTTLMRSIIGLLGPLRGEISIQGQNTRALRPHEVARLGVSYIPQEGALFADLTVEENLRVVLPDRQQFDRASEKALRHFPFLRERFQQRAGTLSGGQQKMLLAARALLPDPRLILADEITEGVQPSQISRIGEALLDANRHHGAAIVVVEQHLDFALELAGRFVVMKQGRVAAEGRTGNVGARTTVETELALEQGSTGV
jgi:ABC-type branched-subunit amino acid transport system ATPase component